MNQTRAILLVNLGSPDSTAIPDVKKYLDQFLMDAHVIDVPLWLRTILVRGVILNIRPKKSAEAYQEIWCDEGSPLVVISQRLQAALQAQMSEPVGLAMRYQNPSIEAGIKDLLARAPNLQEILLVPLYPHYAMATTETVVVETRTVLKRMGVNLTLKVLPPFYQHPAYIEALATVTSQHLDGSEDMVLFSYHGIPKGHVRKTDCTGLHCLKSPDCCDVPSPAHEFCYKHQVTQTTHALAAQLQIKDYEISFQSRLGGGWLTPFTDKRLEQLPKEGKKNIAVLCPAFVSDCLETLEEISMEGREDFLKAGGQTFKYIPCMNQDAAWVEALKILCQEAWQTQFIERRSIPNLVAVV